MELFVIYIYIYIALINAILAACYRYISLDIELSTERVKKYGIVVM